MALGVDNNRFVFSIPETDEEKKVKAFANLNMFMFGGPEDKRLSLAHQEISDIPEKIIKRHGPVTEEIDLSYNNIRDFKFLQEFPKLKSLLLDHNGLTTHSKFPPLPGLHTLWVNHNDIKNLVTFVTMLAMKCPQLRFLSMMNNEAAPSYFNGGTYPQYLDYRHYVISHFEQLETIDDKQVTDEEREEAYRIYGRQWLRAKQEQVSKKKSRNARNARKKSSSSSN